MLIVISRCYGDTLDPDASLDREVQGEIVKSVLVSEVKQSNQSAEEDVQLTL
jgi:hypothetical protein